MRVTSPPCGDPGGSMIEAMAMAAGTLIRIVSRSAQSSVAENASGDCCAYFRDRFGRMKYSETTIPTEIIDAKIGRGATIPATSTENCSTNEVLVVRLGGSTLTGDDGQPVLGCARREITEYERHGAEQSDDGDKHHDNQQHQEQ